MESSGVGNNSSSCDQPFNKHQVRVILLTYSSIGAATVCVCMLGIGLVFYLKLHRVFVYRLAMYQVIGALFFGLTRTLQLISLNDYHEEGDVGACDTVAYLVICSSWVKLMLTLWVTVHLFVFTVFLKNLKVLEPFYVISSVLAGPVIAIIPLITHSYGHAGPWCWIEAHKNQCDQHKKFETGEIEQLAVWYGPAFVVLLIESVLVLVTITVSIFRIGCKLWSTEQESLLHSAVHRQRQALHLLLPLLAYPIIFCVLMTVPLANRIYSIAGTTQNFALFMASAVAIPSMGLAAGIALIAHIAFIKRDVIPKVISFDHFRPSIQTERTPRESRITDSHSHTNHSTQRSTSPTSTCITNFVAVRESEVDGNTSDSSNRLRVTN